MQYSEEYRKTRCVQCGGLLADHRQFTQADVDASKGATIVAQVVLSVNGRPHHIRGPLSSCVIGQWIGHDPMPWRS